MRKLMIAFILFARVGYSQTTVSIIPQPVSVQMGNGEFSITSKTVIVASDAEDRRTADLLNNYLEGIYHFRLAIVAQQNDNCIHLSTKKFVRAPDRDAYNLSVNATGVQIEGDTYTGTFYGIQTLLQLLPVTGKPLPAAGFLLPFVTITDYPRFAYRGMHLDVCRHFFATSFVKKYIDYLALHKMNYFHWHLTDDQGWRIEIKRYPELTKTAAFRNGTIIGRYPGTGNDNLRYGGYYTQDEVKEIVAYAAARYITVIPEIEMPGHSSAAIAAYPWLSCFPEKETVIPSHPSEASKPRPNIPPFDPGSTPVKKVQETWGVFDDIFCAGKDSTFTFLQNVLEEIIPLFPSTYIHIGGDEAPKSNWKACPQCRARIKAEGLKDEHGLQSYFIQRIEQFVNGKGRTIIGWDEILEGGLAPNAVVMSWRGEQGGIEAARQKHKVIMTPGKPVYFDYSQTKNEDSLTIGGYNSLEAVYAYEPIPKEVTADDAKYILGAQANVWTEYMANDNKVEYMIFPRMSALSEVLWSAKEGRNWAGFERRLQDQFKRYDLWKAAYSRAYFDLGTMINSNGGSGLNWQLAKRSKKGTIFYQRPNGTIGLSRDDSIGLTITTPGTYTAWLAELNPNIKPSDYHRHKKLTAPIKQSFYFNKATGKKISITAPTNEKYPGQGGAFGLVNGVYSNKGLSYPDWLGWIGDDLEATLDLGKSTRVDSVRMHTINQNGSWIYLPESVAIATSADGKTFSPAGKSSTFTTDTLTMGWINILVKKTSARYIKLTAKNYGLIPEGQPGAGNKAWLFADEIQVY